jgi:hypothetical protein
MSGPNEVNQLAQILRTTIRNYGLESDQLTMVQVIGVLEVLKAEMLMLMLNNQHDKQSN